MKYIAYIETVTSVRELGYVDHGPHDDMLNAARELIDEHPFWFMADGKRTPDEQMFITRHPDLAIIGTYSVGVCSDKAELPCLKHVRTLGSFGINNTREQRDILSMMPNAEKTRRRINDNRAARRRYWGSK